MGPRSWSDCHKFLLSSTEPEVHYHMSQHPVRLDPILSKCCKTEKRCDLRNLALCILCIVVLLAYFPYFEKNKRRVMKLLCLCTPS
jgi:hypothetical protein